MNFKLWLESDRRIVSNAVLNSITAYGGSQEDDMWMGKHISDIFPHSSDIRRHLLQNLEIQDRLHGRNAVEFITTNDPTFEQFVNWLLEDNTRKKL